jgi:flagellar assembly protein FliH
MAMPQKFTFDVSFDHLEGPTSSRARVERRFTRAEMEATRAAALAEGHAAGLAEAAKSVASLAADSLASIAQGVAKLVTVQDATTFDTQRRAMTAMQSIFAKVFPALAAKDALGEVEAFATKCLHEVIDEPRVVLRVANEIYAPLRERIDTLAAGAGYAGRIVLIADDALAAGDARVEWADGGAERDLAGQCAQIDALIDRRSDPTATPNPVSA